MPKVAAPAPLTSASAFACAHFIDDKVDEVLSPPAGRGETPRLTQAASWH